eukprot:2305418-Amphidinium_carterae.1
MHFLNGFSIFKTHKPLLKVCALQSTGAPLLHWVLIFMTVFGRACLAGCGARRPPATSTDQSTFEVQST